MKTTIKARSNHRVFISFENPRHLDEMVELEIWAPSTGGYVRYETPRGDKQLCARLAPGGETLFWDGTYPLIDLVRREYKAMCAAQKAAQRRDERRYGIQY